MILMALTDLSEFQQILVRFVLDLLAITVLVRLIYFNIKKDQEFSFTMIIFNLVIFFVCYVMQKSNISMGFAFGLFAIFGILRYRTDTIPIKEMTYLFTAIAIALIAAIGPMGYETLMMTVIIIASVFIMEKLWFGNNEQYKIVMYEKINLIQEGKSDVVLEDLRKRIQLNVTRFEIKSMNFLNDSAALKVFYIPQS